MRLTERQPPEKARSHGGSRQHYGLPHLDTGSLYRAVARDVISCGARSHRSESRGRGRPPPRSGNALRPPSQAQGQWRGGIDCRRFSRGSGRAASISEKLRRKSWRRGHRGPRYRHRGMPGSEAKIFVTASPHARARRRYIELKGYGVETTEGAVLAEIEERDRRDRERPVSPLRPAERRALARYNRVRYRKSLRRRS